MKMTIFSLICLSVFSITATAQQVGEAYVKDGIPCVIIDVDEDGKRGLVMSLVPTNKAFKAAKKAGDTKWFYNPPKIKGAAKKLQAEYICELFNQTKCDTVEVRPGFSGAISWKAYTRMSTSLSGKENMKNVIDFCNEKDISMESYFPLFAWALSLGDGWYIPGVEEAKIYITKYMGLEIGKSYSAIEISKIIKNSNVKNYTTSLQNMLEEESSIFSGLDKYADYYGIATSTIVSTSKDQDNATFTSMYLCRPTNLNQIPDLVYGGAIARAVCEVEFK